MVRLDAICAPLFVPANRPELFAKAAGCGADAIILDLEDAVTEETKDSARKVLQMAPNSLPVLVRINAQGTPWHDSDIAEVAKFPFAGVVVPKVEDGMTVRAVALALARPVIATVESARGLSNARAIASVEGVARLAFGSVDFCADLGCAHSRDVLLPVRSELVLASRLADIPAPLDGVTLRVNDQVATFEDAVHARSLGMTGKLCVHPKQISEVKRAFSPSEEEVSWARRVLSSGDGVLLIDGAMVDEPVRIRARAILEKVH